MAACLAANALAGLPGWRLRAEVAALRRIAAARAAAPAAPAAPAALPDAARPAPAAPGLAVTRAACDPAALAQRLAEEDDDDGRGAAAERGPPPAGNAGEGAAAAAQLQACLAAACLCDPAAGLQVRGSGRHPGMLG